MIRRCVLGLLAVVAVLGADAAEARGRRGGHVHHGGGRIVVAPGFYGGYGFAPGYAGYYAPYYYPPYYNPYDYAYPPPPAAYPPYAPYPPYAAYPYGVPPGSVVVIAPGTPSQDPEHLASPRDRGLP